MAGRVSSYYQGSCNTDHNSGTIAYSQTILLFREDKIVTGATAFTGHPFKKILSDKYPAWLQDFKVVAINRRYEFWQPDSLAFPLFGKAVSNQKVEYIYLSPVSDKWQLATSSPPRFVSLRIGMIGAPQR